MDIATLVNQYGYIIIFTSLVLELMALPLPGEIMMSYCGFLIFQGRLNYIDSIIVATTGAIFGTTLSYVVGKKVGIKFFKKYGKYVHLEEDKIDKVSKWFGRYGERLLMIAYFIPGVRHITGYFAGTINLSYKRFALNSYIGAFCWTLSFISLGRFLGESWNKIHRHDIKYLIIGAITLGIIVLVIYIYKTYKDNIIKYIYDTIKYFYKIFNSLEKKKIIIAGILISSVVLLEISSILHN